MELVGWFYFADYLSSYEAEYAIRQLAEVVRIIRGFADFKMLNSRVSLSKDRLIVDLIEFEVLGLTEEFTEEKIKVIYRDGKVEIYRI